MTIRRSPKPPAGGASPVAAPSTSWPLTAMMSQLLAPMMGLFSSAHSVVGDSAARDLPSQRCDSASSISSTTSPTVHDSAEDNDDAGLGYGDSSCQAIALDESMLRKLDLGGGSAARFADESFAASSVADELDDLCGVPCEDAWRLAAAGASMAVAMATAAAVTDCAVVLDVLECREEASATDDAPTSVPAEPGARSYEQHQEHPPAHQQQQAHFQHVQLVYRQHQDQQGCTASATMTASASTSCGAVTHMTSYEAHMCATYLSRHAVVIGANGTIRPSVLQASAPTQQQQQQVFDEDFDAFAFMAFLPPISAFQRPPVALPSKTAGTPRVTLVLDLDETLVHCTVKPDPAADERFTLKFNDQQHHVFLRRRPHLDAFLRAVADQFEVVVFTASHEVYANRVLDIIDPNGLIAHRLFRDSCVAVDGNFVKDLHVLGRDLTSVVLVDNSPYAYGYQVDNGIPITSWFDCPDDTELLELAAFLRRLTDARDVRTVVRHAFRMHKRVEAARSRY